MLNYSKDKISEQKKSTNVFATKQTRKKARNEECKEGKKRNNERQNIHEQIKNK